MATFSLLELVAIHFITSSVMLSKILRTRKIV